MKDMAPARVLAPIESDGLFHFRTDPRSSWALRVDSEGFPTKCVALRIAQTEGQR